MPLIDLPGYRKLLADHRGKPLLITFWATWCEPCREEFPLVNSPCMVSAIPRLPIKIACHKG